MQPETTAKPETDTNSPGSTVNVATSTNGRLQSNGKVGHTQNCTINGQFPPPKTDKPRPHVCNTCGRSFARLEHLKRHERSHTKEKPFECPECTRCFARRDLLLRHQQKLHMTGATPRQRQGRRESMGGASVANGGKIRKNSVANANIGGAAGSLAQQRPRANTIAHVDIGSLGIFNGNNHSVERLNALGLNMGDHNMSMGGMSGVSNFDYRGMSTAMASHGFHGLPKLDTQGINNMDVTNALRTAPPQATFGGFDIDQIFTPHTTINPAALHFGGAGSNPSSNLPFAFDPNTNQQAPLDEDFDWMRNWNMQMTNGNDHENAIDESSPSRISSGDSPGDYSESMTNSLAAVGGQQNNFQWQPPELLSPAQQTMTSGPFQLDALGSGLPDLKRTISPTSLSDSTPMGDAFFHHAMPHPHQNGHRHHQSQPEITHGQNGAIFGQPIANFDSSSPSISSSSVAGGSARQSSVTSVSTDSITESTRQALLNSLSQPSVFGGARHRKQSQPSVSSPLSPGGGGLAARSGTSGQGPSLPSTSDIRRYIDAFLQHTHPHLPICHVPTLSFDVLDINTGTRGSPLSNGPAKGATGGARCLILGMAAIGALYEYEHPASKELFDAAKKMISLYLEERRKADIAAAASGTQAATETPLWLVQAMLLTVIYGHHCGDRIAADIASNHIAALVSLARAANLAQPAPATEDSQSEDVSMNGSEDLQTQWLRWKTVEERKRCLFAIFFLSSLLCIAYNQTPAIMNSEILLDLPCEEELYQAESAVEWQNRGGPATARNTTSFATALSTLLTANQRQANNFPPSVYNSSTAVGAMHTSEEHLKPSTFGCLILICALHNYVWETRSRHRGQEWTIQETESMVAHIEPALNAWQAAWKANDHHKLERPNPFGLGPLSADSIPMLDLAFVRLYVDLGRTAEAFWRRDFDQMAEALAGSQNVNASGEARERKLSRAANSPTHQNGSLQHRRPSQLQNGEPVSSKRERHLRKAAFYAADSLTIACSYDLTYTDATAHELPIQSAICFFDCTQVLAEWTTTVQERAGRYLGVLGRDPIDYTQVPAIMLLEAEDVELLRKIEQICQNMEDKRAQQENLLAMDMNSNFQATAAGAMSGVANDGVELRTCGLGGRILRVTAMMLEKAVIWPITHVMAKALEVEASHMDRRTQTSTLQQ